MSYDYVARKSSLECLFGLGALDKIKVPGTISHRQTSGAFLWGGKLVFKIALWQLIFFYMAPHQKVIPANGECTSSSMKQLALHWCPELWESLYLKGH
ncbi:hypothetical protein TNCV_4623521 [Trichonephila clavipes]|nr:hypothetical protein TNCV_4623521 [Trichonephila clavipes]